jgi:hypothetical protein
MVSRGQTKIENYFSSQPKEEADLEADGGRNEAAESKEVKLEEDLFFEDDDFPVDELFDSFTTSSS